jgi:hypothetical protein
MGRIVRVFAAPLGYEGRRRQLYRFRTNMNGPLRHPLLLLFQKLAAAEE